MTPEFEAWFRKRVHNVRTLDRLLKANRDTEPMTLIRGHWRQNQVWAGRCAVAGYLRKSDFIRKYGREVWGMVPRHAKRRDGRREAASYWMGENLAAVRPEKRKLAAALLRQEWPAPLQRFTSLELRLRWDNEVWGFGERSSSDVFRDDVDRINRERVGSPSYCPATVDEWTEELVPPEEMVSFREHVLAEAVLEPA